MMLMRRLLSENHIFKMSRENPPALTVKPGETLVIETLDGFGGRIKSDNDPFPEIDLDHVNQTTGPIEIAGAQPGDTLAAHIKRITLPRQGVTTIFPGFGVLKDEFNREWKKVCQIRAGKVVFPGGITFPVHPVIGTIGVAPVTGAIGNLYPGPHGGNLDVNDITTGATVYLPVFVPGALFSLGDGKAVMGDGETNGVGIEVSMTVTVTLKLLKGERIERPRLENNRYIMTIASGKSLDAASTTALKDMLGLILERTSLTREQAYALLGAIADVRIANLVDPEITVRVAIPKRILKRTKRVPK
jgi:amidase